MRIIALQFLCIILIYSLRDVSGQNFLNSLRGVNLQCPPEITQKRNDILKQVKDLTQQWDALINECESPNGPRTPQGPKNPRGPTNPNNGGTEVVEEVDETSTTQRRTGKQPQQPKNPRGPTNPNNGGTEVVEEVDETSTTQRRTGKQPQQPDSSSVKVTRTTRKIRIQRTCRFESPSVICTVVTDSNGKVSVTVTKDGTPIEEWEIVEEVTDNGDSILSETTKSKKISDCKGDKCIDVVRSNGKITVTVKRNNEIIVQEEIVEKSSTDTTTTTTDSSITDNGGSSDTILDVLTDRRSKTTVTNTVTRRRCINIQGSEVCKVTTEVNGQVTSTKVTRDGQETNEDWETIVSSSSDATADDNSNDVIVNKVSVVITCTRKAGSAAPVCVERSTDSNGKVTVVTKVNGQVSDRKLFTEDNSKTRRMRDKTTITRTVSGGGENRKRATKRMKCFTDENGKETCEEVATDFSGKETKTVKVREKVPVDE